MRGWGCLLVATLVIPLGATAAPPEGPIVRAMTDELARSMDHLALPGLAKPYFLSYAMWDLRRVRVEASLGAIISAYDYPQRTIDVDLRVGDYAFDDSNTANGDRRQSVSLPAEDSYDVVRHDLWLATDAAYKRAVERLERKKAVAKNETKADDVPSFSQEPPSHIVDEPVTPPPDRVRLEALAKTLSAVFRKNADVYAASVMISAVTGRQYFVSSEGSQSVAPANGVVIDIECQTQADDGTPIHDATSFWAATADQLPPEAELVAQVDKLSRELSALRKAPVVDDYGGPILFTGIAAGQVMRGLLAQNLAGTPAPKGDRPGVRESGDSELIGKVGARILPKDVSVVDDPTISHLGKLVLVGGARFDEEGVPMQRVSLVEHGRLQRFLMSRTPRKGFEHSNGHGATSAYSSVRARPANLIVASAKGVSDAEIRRRALAAARDEDLKYILIVDKLDQGGSDVDPSMFSDDGLALPKPAVMRRVYLDGHEELVRGGSFAAMPVRSLKDVLAIGSTPTVYSYYSSGAASRYEMLAGNRASATFSVSLVCPPLLFRDVDVKKPTGPQKKPPIAPRPALP